MKKVLQNRYIVLFGGLFLLLALSFGLSFIGYGGYALTYLPFVMGLALLFLGFLLLKDGKAKAYRLRPLSFLSAKLASKEAKRFLFLAVSSTCLLLLFFARYYFWRGRYDYTDSYGRNGFFYYYDVLHLESQLIVNRLPSYLLSRYEMVVGTLSNDLWTAAAILALVSIVYLKESSLLARRYIGSPIALLLTLAFPILLKGIVGEEIYSYRAFLMGMELALIDFSFFSSFLEEGRIKFNKREICKLFAILIPLLLTMSSSYTASLLFGTTIKFGDRSLTNPHDPADLSHRFFIYSSFFLPILYFCLLYPLSKQDRRGMLLQISLATFFGYISINRFNIWLDVTSWPLHLCNTAMYTMPITLLFLSYGLYYFTFFINVLGAFFALLMPNFSESLAVFDPEVMAFYINHLHAFFMPVLIMLLGVYKRPKMKYFIYSQVGFFLYFALVMFVNVDLTAKGKSVDFFFINSDFVADKLGKWAEDLFAMEVTFERNGLTYNIHLIYDIIYYFVYVILAFGMWFGYELLFRSVDELVAIRVAKERNISRHEAYLAIKEGGLFMDKGKASLSIEHLSKKYHGATHYAVTDFSLSLEGGKIYGFLGKNGAGKSTIIKSIVGIHGFDEGVIRVSGYDVLEEPLEAKKEIGFVPDNYALYENLTGRQYVGYVADLYRVPKEERKRIENNLVERLELGQRYDQPMKTYSHGMKQKITIIAALIHNPKIWILDEPMTGLDPNSIYQIKECMKEHAKAGNIVFFSSHIIDVVKNLCDEVIIIKKGHLVETIDLDMNPARREDLEETFLRLTSDDEKEANILIEEERKEKAVTC